MTTIKFKKLTPEAVIPYYASDEAAAFDLTATSVRYEVKGHFIEYGTGLASEIPVGYVGLIFPRSSISKFGLQLANSVGVVDSDYRGEWLCRFKTTTQMDPIYEVGDRVAQAMIIRAPRYEIVDVESLGETNRGEGGFGSTGA